MPHLVLEHSNNLPPFAARDVLRAMNAAVVTHLGVEEAAVKSRTLPHADFVVGTVSDSNRAFAHLRVHTRHDDGTQLKALSDALVAIMAAALPGAPGQDVQYTVDILHMNPDVFGKTRVSF